MCSSELCQNRERGGRAKRVPPKPAETGNFRGTREALPKRWDAGTTGPPRCRIGETAQTATSHALFPATSISSCGNGGAEMCPFELFTKPRKGRTRKARPSETNRNREFAGGHERPFQDAGIRGTTGPLHRRTAETAQTAASRALFPATSISPCSNGGAETCPSELCQNREMGSESGRNQEFAGNARGQFQGAGTQGAYRSYSVAFTQRSVRTEEDPPSAAPPGAGPLLNKKGGAANAFQALIRGLK